MSALLIKSDKTGNKIFKELAKKIGAEVLLLDDEQYEDLALGLEMDRIKTNELVDRELIFSKLRNK
jgi:hypothetical protein